MHDGKAELEAIRSALDGDGSGLDDILDQYRTPLRRMIAARLDPRLQARVDASDVIQESYLDVAKTLRKYVDNPEIPFFFWVRHLTGVKLANLHRRHLGAQKRDPRREVRPYLRGTPDASSIYLAGLFVDDGTTPSGHAARNEEREHLEQGLDALSDEDRELLALRHAEDLDNVQIAQLMGITVNAVNIRYFRAARRLAELVERFGGDGRAGTGN